MYVHPKIPVWPSLFVVLLISIVSIQWFVAVLKAWAVYSSGGTQARGTVRASALLV